MLWITREEKVLFCWRLRNNNEKKRQVVSNTRD